MYHVDTAYVSHGYSVRITWIQDTKRGAAGKSGRVESPLFCPNPTKTHQGL